MGGKRSSPPPAPTVQEAPDYTGAAEAQADSSREIALATTTANRPNLYTPWGSQTWSNFSSVDPATGAPVTRWESTIRLTPEQQAALDSQTAVQVGRSQAAEMGLDKAVGALQRRMPYEEIVPRQAITNSPEINPDLRAWRLAAEDNVMRFQKPIQQERREGLETQLANMGLSRGTEAWDREMRTLSDQDTRDNLQAFAAGREEAKFNLDNEIRTADFNLTSDLRAGEFNNRARQQGFAETYQERIQPLNELNALLTGQQVQSPQMPTFNTATAAQPTQYLNAANSQWNATTGAYDMSLGAYNANQANRANNLAGLTSIAGLFL